MPLPSNTRNSKRNEINALINPENWAKSPRTLRKNPKMSVDIHCVKCDSLMVLKSRKYDGKKFWGCGNYPECCNTRSFEEHDLVAPPEPPKKQFMADGAACRHCSHPLKKKMTSKKKPIKSTQKYIYLYYFVCTGCKRNYMPDQAKRKIKAKPEIE